jgi:hypothetical protein
MRRLSEGKRTEPVRLDAADPAQQVGIARSALMGALPKISMLSGEFFLPPAVAEIGLDEHYVTVTCTVMTDEPELVGPCPVALITNVSAPVYLAFALYS